MAEWNMRKASIVAVAIALLVSNMAGAQPAPLEGQVRPGATSAELKQGPRRGQQAEAPSAGGPALPAPAQLDAVEIRNATGSPMWVNVRQRSGIHTSGCVMPREQSTWTLGARPATYTIEAQLTRGPDCAPPPTCRATIERTPAMRAIELRAGAKGCRLQAAAQEAKASPPPLRAGAHYTTYTFFNDSTQPAWITVYYYNVIPTRIVRTHCLLPGRGWVYPFGVYNDFRAEFTAGSGNCSGRLNYDSGRVGLEVHGHDVADYSLRCDAQKCWFNWISSYPYDWRDRMDPRG